MRVLAVDDDKDLLLLYRVTLESDGHEVSEATSGVAALQAAHAGTFDLILLDMMLPEIDGFGVLDALGAGHLTDELAVVIVSARVGIEDQIRGLQSGAVAYLTKPFSVDVLRSLVTSLGAMDHDDLDALRSESLARIDLDQLAAADPTD